MAQNRFANLGNITAGAQVHHSIGTEVHGSVELLEFFVNIRRHGGIANIGVDLAQGGHADGHRFELRMIDVGGNDHATASDFVAN